MNDPALEVATNLSRAILLGINGTEPAELPSELVAAMQEVIAGSYAKQTRDLEKLLKLLADDDLAAEVAAKCDDECHDDRYCSTCEHRMDGIDAYRNYVLEQLKASANGNGSTAP